MVLIKNNTYTDIVLYLKFIAVSCMSVSVLFLLLFIYNTSFIFGMHFQFYIFSFLFNLTYILVILLFFNIYMALFFLI